MMKLTPAATNPYPTLDNYEYPDLTGSTAIQTSQKPKPSDSPIQRNPTATKLLREGHSEAVISACMSSLDPRQLKIVSSAYARPTPFHTMLCSWKSTFKP